VPLHEPFRISSGDVSIRDSILVELEAKGAGGSNSQTGWGEASPMPGNFYSSETPEATWDFLVDRLAPSFLDRPELDPRRCWDRLAEFPGEPFAKAGIEGAVWTSTQSETRGRCGRCLEARTARSNREQPSA